MAAWKDRFNDYTATRASITSTELDANTSEEWQTWCQAWELYVKQGGVRPNNRPPV